MILKRNFRNAIYILIVAYCFGGFMHLKIVSFFHHTLLFNIIQFRQTSSQVQTIVPSLIHIHISLYFLHFVLQ